MENLELKEFYKRKGLKTYSHLLKNKKIPSDYEIMSSHLLYYPEKGFAIKNDIAKFYEKSLNLYDNSIFLWEEFFDPKNYTYFTYIEERNKKEVRIQSIFKVIENKDFGNEYAEKWICTLAPLLSAGRYYFHSLQMLAAFCGQMAPSGKIVNCLLFQASDELRNTQHFAYRLGLIRKYYQFEHDVYFNSLIFEKDMIWQPLKKLLEEILQNENWLEVLIALNFCIKPAYDYILLQKFSDFAKEFDDEFFSLILFELFDDTNWHHEWSKELYYKLLKDKINFLPITKKYWDKILSTNPSTILGYDKDKCDQHLFNIKMKIEGYHD